MPDFFYIGICMLDSKKLYRGLKELADAKLKIEALSRKLNLREID